MAIVSGRRIDDILTPNGGSQDLKFEVPCLALSNFFSLDYDQRNTLKSNQNQTEI